MVGKLTAFNFSEKATLNSDILCDDNLSSDVFMNWKLTFNRIWI